MGVLTQKSTAASPLTIGEALAERDQRLFVGREREMAEMCSWFSEAGDTPGILSVTGPGGVGKTTLLRTFAWGLRPQQSVAFPCREAGWSVMVGDSDPFGSSCQLRALQRRRARRSFELRPHGRRAGPCHRRSPWHPKRPYPGRFWPLWPGGRPAGRGHGEPRSGEFLSAALTPAT